MYNILMAKWSAKQKFWRWCDGWRLAAMGIVLATRKIKFWIVLLLAFLIFGTLMVLLSSGTGTIDLFFAGDFGQKIVILRDAFLALFGVNRAFLDWLLVFSISLLQGLLISLIALVWKKKRNKKLSGGGDVQNAGIVAGLAILGSGCPTCGTSLLAPVLGAIFSASGYSMLNTITWIITALAIIIALLSIKKVGEEAYVIMVDEEWSKTHPRRSQNEK